jgi:hypothetical protein
MLVGTLASGFESNVYYNALDGGQNAFQGIIEWIKTD